MNCVPGGYEDESSDDDAFIYLNDYVSFHNLITFTISIPAYTFNLI